MLAFDYDEEQERRIAERVRETQDQYAVPLFDAKILEVLSRYEKQENGGLSRSQISYLYTCIMKVIFEEKK